MWAGTADPAEGGHAQGLTRGKVRAGDSARGRSRGARGVEVDSAGPRGTESSPRP